MKNYVVERGGFKSRRDLEEIYFPRLRTTKSLTVGHYAYFSLVLSIVHGLEDPWVNIDAESLSGQAS
jgi:hypothetical protein